MTKDSDSREIYTNELIAPACWLGFPGYSVEDGYKQKKENNKLGEEETVFYLSENLPCSPFKPEVNENVCNCTLC